MYISLQKKLKSDFTAENYIAIKNFYDTNLYKFDLNHIYSDKD